MQTHPTTPYQPITAKTDTARSFTSCVLQEKNGERKCVLFLLGGVHIGDHIGSRVEGKRIEAVDRLNKSIL